MKGTPNWRQRIRSPINLSYHWIKKTLKLKKRKPSSPWETTHPTPTADHHNHPMFSTQTQSIHLLRYAKRNPYIYFAHWLLIRQVSQALLHNFFFSFLVVGVGVIAQEAFKWLICDNHNSFDFNFFWGKREGKTLIY